MGILLVSKMLKLAKISFKRHFKGGRNNILNFSYCIEIFKILENFGNSFCLFEIWKNYICNKLIKTWEKLISSIFGSMD